MEGCAPFCSDFFYESPGQNSAYVTASWEIRNKVFKGKKFSYCFNNPGEYLIKASFNDTTHHCSSGMTFTVTAHTQPQADFNWLPELPVEESDEVLFSSSSDIKMTNWQWFFMNDSLKQVGEQARFLFQDPGVYPVTLIVTDEKGCADTLTKAVEVFPDVHLYVPNAFSPNGDRINEVFLRIGRGISRYELQIFNRWGELIFTTTELQQGWDGSFKGKASPPDNYTWKISYHTIHGERKELAGNVSLLR
jgi:gliding motility-associated-like protein